MCMKIYRARQAKIVVEKELGPVLLQRWLSASATATYTPHPYPRSQTGGFNDH